VNQVYLTKASVALGKEIAGHDRGAAIGDAAALRPVGIARIRRMSAAPQRRMHERAGDQRQRPRPFETGRQHRGHSAKISASGHCATTRAAWAAAKGEA
jgi:hypothetical protein